jgi:hypothetical protein
MLNGMDAWGEKSSQVLSCEQWSSQGSLRLPKRPHVNRERFQRSSVSSAWRLLMLPLGFCKQGHLTSAPIEFENRGKYRHLRMFSEATKP